MVAEPTVVPLRGELAEDAYRELHRTLRGRRHGETVVLDCSGLSAADELAAARLLRLIAEARAEGVEVRLTRIPDELRRILLTVDPAILDAAKPPARRNPVEVIGERALETAESAREIGDLLRDAAANVAVPFGREGIKWDRAFEQMALVGVNAVPIVVFISFLVGIVLALNGAAQLRQFGAAIFIANLVGIAMTREMGPLMTAIIVSGRSGSAIAAELGTMKVSEEIDAMETMALSPTRFLVVPKIVALALMMPLLTVLSNAAGILGGYFIGVVTLDLGSSAYVSQTVQALFVSDVLTGLLKSVVFAVIIGVVGAYRGLTVRGGPEAVGRATTSAVVTSIILCIVANAFFTAFFYYTD
jgi:phospholipid/cholesterol/gamma-HCH transport system permease protein